MSVEARDGAGPGGTGRTLWGVGTVVVEVVVAVNGGGGAFDGLLGFLGMAWRSVNSFEALEGVGVVEVGEAGLGMIRTGIGWGSVLSSTGMGGTICSW